MLIWFIAGIVLLLIELIGFGLISIWFALGAFVTMFFTTLELEYQLFIFALVSFISLFTIRKIAVDKLKNSYKKTDRVVDAVVKIKELKEDGNYLVYTDGKYWTAVCDTELKIGDEAIVEKIQGNKLILKYKNIKGDD